MFHRYIKTSFWFCLLSCLISWCLCRMCFLGFHVNPALQNNQALLIGMVVALTVILWLVSYSNRTKLFGTIALVAAAVIALLAIYGSGNIAVAVKDSEENPYSYFVICFVVIIGVWLLAATKRGLIVLLILGIFVSALIAFLYMNNSLVWLGGFLAGCIVLYALRYYYGSVINSQTVKTSFLSTFVVALILAAVILAGGSAVYVGVVKTIEPPAHELKLYDKEKLMTAVNKLGVSKTVTVLDPNLTSNQTDDDNEEQNQQDDTKGDEQNDDDAQDGNQGNGIDNWNELENQKEMNVISYDLPEDKIWPIILAIIIAAAVVIILRILSRRWWLASVMKRSKEERIIKMYHFWLKKYRQLKLGKNKEETPYEFALRQQEHLASFATERADMMKLTDIFVETNYGLRMVSEEEWQTYLEFHKKFYRMIFKYLGPLRFVFKFFIL